MQSASWRGAVRRFAWALACASLAACGGGGAGGSGETSDTVAGTVHASTASGGWQPAAAVPVQLVTLDAQGQVTATLSRGVTGSDGTFQLTRPAPATGADRQAVLWTAPDGTPVRALAYGSPIEVHAGSEVVTQALLGAAAQRGAPLGESARRMARLQYGASLFLYLMAQGAAGERQRVAELRPWLRRDPATAQALDMLAASGVLPPTLGDLGGLNGAVRSAFELEDSAQPTRTMLLRASAADASRLELFALRRDPFGALMEPQSSPVASLRLRDDSIVTIEPDIPSGLPANVLGVFRLLSSGAFGPRIGEPIGSTVQVNNPSSPALGYSFDSDSTIDTFTRTVRATALGVESVHALGTTLRALRVQTTTEVIVALSSGTGELRFNETRVEWQVPFAGVVLRHIALALTDAAGTASHLPLRTQSLRRVVAGGMSWPGRFYLGKLPWPSTPAPSGMVGLKVTPQGHLLAGDVDPYKFTPPTQLQLIDSNSGVELARHAIAPLRAAVGVFVSTDGSKVYLLHTARRLIDANNEPVRAVPLAQAVSEGALVQRLDSATLRVEATIPLPPRPSSRWTSPAYGFPTSDVSGVVPSPSDPLDLVLDTPTGTIMIRGDAVLPRRIDAEVEGFLSSPPTLRPPTSRTQAWDPLRSELHVQVRQTSRDDYLPRVVPLTPEGPDYLRARVGPQFVSDDPFAAPIAWHAPDGVDGRRMYVNGLTTVFDLDTGALLGRRYAGLSSYLTFGSECDRSQDAIWCLAQGVIQQRDLVSLQVSRTWDAQQELRIVSGHAFGVGGSLLLTAPREAVAPTSPSTGFAGQLIRIAW